jgi:hypothetical protein
LTQESGVESDEGSLEFGRSFLIDGVSSDKRHFGSFSFWLILNFLSQSLPYSNQSIE